MESLRWPVPRARQRPASDVVRHLGFLVDLVCTKSTSVLLLLVGVVCYPVVTIKLGCQPVVVVPVAVL